MFNETPKDRFFGIIYWNTVSISPQSDTRLWQNTVSMEFTKSACLMTLADHEIYLERIRAIQENDGMGTKAMEWISQIADEENVSIFLHAAADGGCSIKTEKLYRFYGSFDFQIVSGNLLKRLPIHDRQSLSVDQPTYKSNRTQALTPIQ